MRNGQLKPGYNVQIAVNSEYITGLEAFSDRGDAKTFRPKMRKLAEKHGKPYNLDQCGYPHEEEEILSPLDLIHRYEEQRASLNAEIDRVLSEIITLLGGNAE